MTNLVDNFGNAKTETGTTSAPAPTIKCLALDIGGVFHGDVWESIFEAGLAEHYGLDMPTVMKLGHEIWPNHGFAPSTEEAYWQDWEQRLGYPLDRDLIAQCREKVWIDKSVVPLVERCLENNIHVCLITNNTSFWFQEQMALTGLDRLADKMTYYLSQTMGVSKTHPDGGLAQLAKNHAPNETLFIDDRVDNANAGKRLGMNVLHYTYDPARPLMEIIAPMLFGKTPAAQPSVSKDDPAP